MTTDPQRYRDTQRKSGVVTWGEASPLLPASGRSHKKRASKWVLRKNRHFQEDRGTGISHGPRTCLSLLWLPGSPLAQAGEDRDQQHPGLVGQVQERDKAVVGTCWAGNRAPRGRDVERPGHSGQRKDTGDGDLGRPQEWPKDGDDVPGGDREGPQTTAVPGRGGRRTLGRRVTTLRRKPVHSQGQAEAGVAASGTQP